MGQGHQQCSRHSPPATWGLQGGGGAGEQPTLAAGSFRHWRLPISPGQARPMARVQNVTQSARVGLRKGSAGTRRTRRPRPALSLHGGLPLPLSWQKRQAGRQVDVGWRENLDRAQSQGRGAPGSSRQKRGSLLTRPPFQDEGHRALHSRQGPGESPVMPERWLFPLLFAPGSRWHVPKITK